MNKRKVFSLLCMGLLISNMILISPLSALCVRADGEDVQEEKLKEPEEEIVEISTQEELKELEKLCHDDAWSYHKTIRLTADISIGGVFNGIPSFNGTFDGNGHTINNFRSNSDGYIFGFFNEIGKDGLVENLNLKMDIKTGDDAKCIGGIAGVNAGCIKNCKVYGTLAAGYEVGGIAGINQESGRISGCENNAQITGFYYTGGIAGKNYGTVEKCKNKGEVNSNANWIRLEDENSDNPLSSVTDTSNLISVHSGVDTGGIVGYSIGLIEQSENDATVGYEHAGYNVGGIAGRQSGILFGCYNNGVVYGKKDVGGIVGQQEPYIEVNQGRSVRYMADCLTEDVDRLIRDSEEAKDGISDDLRALKQSSDSLKDSVNKITKDVSDSGEDTQTFADKDKDTIKEDIENVKENGATKEDFESIVDRNRQSAEEKKNSFREDDQNWKADVETLNHDLDRVSEALSTLGNNTKNSTETVYDDIQAVNERVDNIYHLLSDIRDGVEGDGAEYLFSDISEEALNLPLTGKTIDCVNRGVVKGDIDVGGVAGALAIDDENLESNKIVTLGLKTGEAYSTVSVISGCTNEGFLTSRKDKTGGIAGFVERGIIYDSYGFGDVSSTEGSYVGGICGQSEGVIDSSYALCTLTGASFVGGIAGSANKVKNCVSMPLISCKGDNVGAIAGEIPRDKLTKELDLTGIRGNVFVSDDHFGIDEVSYRDIAEKRTYEELCKIKGLPAAYKHLKITFRVDDEIISSREVKYGEDLSATEFPEVPGVEGKFVSWPDLTGRKMLCNMVVEAQYLQNITVIASELKEAESEVPIAFVGGGFNAEDSITVEECPRESVLSEVPEAAGRETKVYHIAVNESQKTEERRLSGDNDYTVRLYKPFAHCHVFEIDEEAKTVRKAEYTERGRYLSLSLPNREATYVLVEAKNTKLLIFGIAAAFAVLLIVIIVVISITNKKRKMRAGKEQKED